MTNSHVTDRVAALRAQLDDYSYQYHSLDSPIVSDAVYDGLFGELKDLEAQHPELVTPDSPTQRVGNALLNGFTKVRHSSRMLSLNDVFDESEVQSWVERTRKLIPDRDLEFFADIKMDGLACALVYEDGVLIQAVTRGDSYEGEDVTMNVRTIKNVPLRLREEKGYEHLLSGRTEVRGEIVMLKKEFEKLNEVQAKAGKPAFANPRNLAAGTIRQLDPKLVAARPLSFRAYDLIRENADEVPTNMQAYEAIDHIGLTRNKQASVFNRIDAVMEFVHFWGEKRHDLPFNTDGLVVKLNDRKLYAELGVVGKQPRAAIAYKYAADQAVTVVRDIVLNIGRTGVATPVAVFDPVVVAGTTVQHATLHNADEIARKDIRIDDTVVIYKAGDIIPQVESVVENLRPKDSKPFIYDEALKAQYPELTFERIDGETAWRVKGATPKLLLSKSLEHFASKSALDIDTLGEKNVIALVEGGLVHDLADVYALTYEDVVKLDRFADISARKLVAAINDKKTPPLERFVYALGIRHVGTQTAIDLAGRFGSLDAIGAASMDELESVDGIGKIVAEAVAAWFGDPEGERLIAKFASLGVSPTFETHEGALTGSSFVVTGTLGSMSREEAAERIRSLGGVFQNSVAKGTTYLVAGGKVGESKLKNAQKYGTKVIDEEAFLSLLNM